MTSLRFATRSSLGRMASEGAASCPSDEVLGAFVEGRLERTALRRVAEHLRGCDTCCELIERYASAWQLDVAAIGTASPSTALLDEPIAALQPGQSFARFVLLHLAGRGGMAEVYSAYDPVLDRRVALKLLHEHESAAARARMLQEARTVAALSHPHIVAIYDVGRAHGRDYIAMEFVEGGTLAHWLGASSRTDAEILDVFRQAGLGLAAAHERGIVHRDFKPANVLVGASGDARGIRVRVADFGLALPRGVAATRAGTRGYVAPEQAAGAPPDPLADQYSFCVAMHEALGAGPPAVTERAPVATPPRPSARRIGSRRIAAVLARGMHPEPARRFASMPELLAALAPSRRRPLLAIGTMTIVLAFISLGWAADAERCPSTDELRATLWTTADRERAHAAFAASGLPYADMAWSRSERVVDARVDAWAEQAHSRCQSATTASGCETRARIQLQETIGMLAHADATTVTQAGALVDALANDACDEASTVSAVDPLQHVTLVGDLALAKAQKLAGRTAIARTDLEQVIDRARELGDDRVRREAELELAAILPSLGEEDAAIALLRDLAYGAIADGDDTIALDALTALVLVEGGQRDDIEAGQRWDRDATAILARIDAPAHAHAKLERARGAMHIKSGDFAAATASFRRVLAHAEATHGPDHRSTASALRDLGLALFNADQLDQARDEVERSLEIRERELGPEHPDVADSLGLLFAIERGRGEYDRSLELAERALAIYERAHGPDHLDTINARMRLGLALEHTDMHAAHEAMEVAVEALARTLGRDHMHTTSARYNLAHSSLVLQRYDDALGHAREVHEVWRRLHGDEHVMTIAAAIKVGTALMSLGRTDEARPWLDDALARSRDHAPARLAAAHDALANLESAEGNFARAAELYDLGAANWALAYGAEHPETKASRGRADTMRELAAGSARER